MMDMYTYIYIYTCIYVFNGYIVIVSRKYIFDPINEVKIHCAQYMTSQKEKNLPFDRV